MDAGASTSAGAAAGAVAGPSEAAASAAASAAVRAGFENQLKSFYVDLSGRGLAPNEAINLAMNVAAGACALPPALPTVLAAVVDAGHSGATGPAEAALEALFGSLPALSAAFLPDAAMRAAADAAEAARPRIAPAALPRGPAFAGLPAAAAAAAGAPVLDYPALARRALATDFDAFERLFGAIAAVPDDGARGRLERAATRAMHALAGALGDALLAPEAPLAEAGPALRNLLLLLQAPILIEPEYHPLLLALVSVLVALPARLRPALLESFVRYPTARLAALVETLQQLLTLRLYGSIAIDAGAEMATRGLEILHAANERAAAAAAAAGAPAAGAPGGPLAMSAFYNGAVNNDDFNVAADYRRWRTAGRDAGFAFLAFPFVYDAGTKGRVLQLESQHRMTHQFEEAMMRSIFGAASQANPFFVLRVRRSHLIHDTLHAIDRAPPADLQKPLKVHFLGEEGIDEGGVAKEFFQLLLRQILDPSFGMFAADEEAHTLWFSGLPLDLDREFALVGTLLGLALYNSHILDLHFPQLLYKLLMSEAYVPTLSDLSEIDPALGRSLRALLAHTPAAEVEEAFGLTFEAASTHFGTTGSVEIVPGGAQMAVTGTNREHYVEMYVRHRLEVTIRPQLAAFRRGFNQLCAGAALQLFRPRELEQLICGSQELDFAALEQATRYGEGFTASSQLVRWFWEVVHALAPLEKRRLLFFATGSDRVPIRGMSTIRFMLQRNGPSSDRLPTAHTCFNVLLLPEYGSKEQLRDRLLTAISNSEGFGLR